MPYKNYMNKSRLSILCVFTCVSFGNLFEVKAQVSNHPEAKDAPQIPEPKWTGAKEVHLVQPGDTLWDLCGEYLDNPWFWPKVWSYNPQIKDPHLIYPGDKVRFFPGAFDVASAPVQTVTVEPTDESELPNDVPNRSLKLVEVSGKIGREGSSNIWARGISFISEGRHQVSGEISNSESESLLLSNFDIVYVKELSGVKVGDRLGIYRTRRIIKHPKTGKFYGYSVDTRGVAKVVGVEKKVVRARIERAYKSIERGDRVGPLSEGFAVQIRPAINDQNLQGYIIGTSGDELGPVGEHHLVYIDLGRQHGVRVGHKFSVIRQGDRYTQQREGLPKEPVGSLLVVQTEERAATALISNSIHEMWIGDRIEMVSSLALARE